MVASIALFVGLIPFRVDVVIDGEENQVGLGCLHGIERRLDDIRQQFKQLGDAWRDHHN